MRTAAHALRLARELAVDTATETLQLHGASRAARRGRRTALLPPCVLTESALRR
ncbi:hypothetical protein [Streptomyces sp. KL116D]|uniref:hypothetical protein n=1 Tax=Streptomyces sp. KL116D TaxID=3045152 RepID=UPI003558978A